MFSIHHQLSGLKFIYGTNCLPDYQFVATSIWTKKNCFELVSILSRRVLPILILVLEHFSKFGFFRAKVKLGLILQLFSGCFQQNANDPNQHNNSV